jgi:hypothetical protein
MRCGFSTLIHIVIECKFTDFSKQMRPAALI